jgi:hypothetical protein
MTEELLTSSLSPPRIGCQILTNYNDKIKTKYKRYGRNCITTFDVMRDAAFGEYMKIMDKYKTPESIMTLSYPITTAATTTTSKDISNETLVIHVKRALLIGINYVGSKDELKGCVNDVETVRKLLVDCCGFSQNNITVMVDVGTGNIKPTKKNILKYMKSLVNITKAGDELFIHYSGHGSQLPCLCGDEIKNPDTPCMDDLICPCDFDNIIPRFITDDVLREELVEKLPTGAKLRAVFDCCNSGTALDLPYLYKGNDKFTSVNKSNLKCEDCLLLSGCRDDQTSADSKFNGKAGGALTWAFDKAFRSCKKSGMTWKDLFVLVRHFIADKEFDQIPTLSVGSKEVLNKQIDV